MTATLTNYTILHSSPLPLIFNNEEERLTKTETKTETKNINRKQKYRSRKQWLSRHHPQGFQQGLLFSPPRAMLAFDALRVGLVWSQSFCLHRVSYCLRFLMHPGSRCASLPSRPIFAATAGKKSLSSLCALPDVSKLCRVHFGNHCWDLKSSVVCSVLLVQVYLQWQDSIWESVW